MSQRLRHPDATPSEALARCGLAILVSIAVLLVTGVDGQGPLSFLACLYITISVGEAIFWAPIARRRIHLAVRWAPEIFGLLTLLHLLRILYR